MLLRLRQLLLLHKSSRVIISNLSAQLLEAKKQQDESWKCLENQLEAENEKFQRLTGTLEQERQVSEGMLFSSFPPHLPPPAPLRLLVGTSAHG